MPHKEARLIPNANLVASTLLNSEIIHVRPGLDAFPLSWYKLKLYNYAMWDMAYGLDTFQGLFLGLHRLVSKAPSSLTQRVVRAL